MERKLAHVQMLLRETQRLAKVGSWELDLVSRELSWSDEIFRIFEIEPAAFAASYEAFLALVHPDDRALVNESYERSVRERKPYTVVHRLCMQDGRIKHVEERGETFYDESGHPVRSLGTVQDITVLTEKLRAERELAQTRERLSQTQRLEAIGRLAGGVAHDFNNLLTVILGMSRMLRPLLVGQTQGLTLLSDIHEAGTRAADLVSRLLAFARRRPVEGRAVDINVAIHSFAHLLSRIVGARIVFVTELCPDSCQVWIDPSQVEQLLLNLSVNARDAMPDGGCLRLRTRISFRPADETQRPWVILEVEDNGCGMPEEVSSRMFEPFFSTKAFGEGSGLGMSIVYGIVVGAGGEVMVRSAPGEGTAFTIWLPAHDGETVDLAQPSGKDGCTVERATLCVAEDEERSG